MTRDRWHRIETVCHSALAQPEHARAAFLATACGNDGALRQEVESLLAQERDAAGFMSASPVNGIASAMVEQPRGTLIGRRLGSYTFRALLGVGGMGEVYRAHDEALGRDVAIKVLPPAFTADPLRRARLTREARILATLNHPHIGAIYGVVEGDGVRGLVLELVEGETLSQRLRRGAMTADKVLPVARHIADALEAAHEHGIIHCDLTPTNISITPDGVVKVLDFGLARLIEPLGADSDVAPRSSTEPPAVTSPAAITGGGVMHGTAAYMAPEQAMGRLPDTRSDVWSFGCVLFEMLTGARAFRGENIAETLAAVIHAEPDWEALPADVPPALRLLLTKSLVKDRTYRLSGVSAVQFLLTHGVQLGLTPDALVLQPPAHVRPRWRRAAPYVLGVVVLAVATGYFFRMTPTGQAPLLVSRFAVLLGPNDQFTNPGRHLVAVSSDGKRIAYAANNRLYLRALDQINASALRGIDGAGTASPRNPFFSPDGQWIGFWAGGQMKKMAVSGGAAVPLTSAQNPHGASWSQDNTILYGQGAGGVWRVSADGRRPERIVEVASGQLAHGPQLLPGGRAVLFTLSEGEGRWDQAQIVVQVLDTGVRHVVVNGGTDARYLRTGHLVYAQRGTLMAVRFDARSYQVAGSAVPVVEGVSQPGVIGAVQFSVADSGALVYVPADVSSAPLATLAWVDREGRESSIPAPPRGYRYARLSPDGTSIALDLAEENRDIWVWDLVRTTLTRLTSDPAIDQNPIWTDRGRSLLFSSSRDGGVANLYRQRADGTGPVERLTKSTGQQFPTAVTPDETRAILMEPGQGDVMVLGLAPPHHLERVARTPFSERNGVVSPDGNWLAYSADDSGRPEIYVRRFPTPDAARWQVSTGGGVQPLWSRGGGELFFRALTGALMFASVHSGSAWSVSRPAVLFDARPYLLGTTTFARTYDVAPGDSRFLFIKQGPLEPGASPQIIVVQNWFDELNRRAPR
jgi:Tol biopolymer transport system component